MIKLPALHILMIEDCPQDAELALRNLKRHSVTIVNTLKAGIDELKVLKFDLVFLDLNLANGIKEKVFAQVKDVRGKAATVILTGDANPETKDLHRHLKADGYMVKGVDDQSPTDVETIMLMAIQHRKGIT